MDLDTRTLIGLVQRRSGPVANRSTFDKDNGLLQLAFASETPVMRDYGVEVLSCSPDVVDLSRLKNGAPLLRNHDADEHIGVVVDASVDPDKVCRALVKLGRTEDALEARLDIEDEILRHVSVGYELTRLISRTDGPDGIPIYTWAWKPLEISMVAIPADDSVGVGRSLDVREVKQMPAEVVGEETKMDEVKEVETPVAPAASVVEVTQDDVKAERAEIARLGKQHKLAGLAERALVEGWTLDAFRKEAMNEIGKENGKVQETATIGLTPNEVKQYSFRNMILSQVPNSGVKAEFERECSEAAAKLRGVTPKGMFVPFDVMVGKRDVAVSGTGSNVVATNLLSGSFIDALRAKALLAQLGVTYITGLNGDIAIPKLLTKSSAYWIETEGNAPTESTPAFTQLPATPHTVGTYVDVTRKLLKQSSVDVESILRGDIAQVLATAIDVAAIDGAGASGEPSGLYNHASDVSVTAGTPTYAEILNMLAGIEAANAGTDNMKWAMTPAVMVKLAATVQSTYGSDTVLDMATRTCLGYPVIASSSVKAKYGFLGNWANLVVAMWGGLDVLVDPYTASNTGTVRINAFQDCDIIVRHPTGFSMADIVS